jgi:hypothetical protein
MAKSPLDYKSNPDKFASCVRLETQFEAAIGEIDEQLVHVEVKPRWKPNSNGGVDFTQVIADSDIGQIVEDVNALSNVGTLDLTENDITDASVEHLKLLKMVSELWLGGTKITEMGIKKLEKALPDTNIGHDFAEPDRRS